MGSKSAEQLVREFGSLENVLLAAKERVSATGGPMVAAGLKAVAAQLEVDAELEGKLRSSLHRSLLG